MAEGTLRCSHDQVAQTSQQSCRERNIGASTYFGRTEGIRKWRSRKLSDSECSSGKRGGETADRNGARGRGLGGT